ncbi:ABC transporter permease [Aquipuribacter sp. SD81]|uniref:ABC transporter permease n=1 Tax=Aquipuribacter sp. SD81 TaxID=3127703 RepID=UPI0030196697
MSDSVLGRTVAWFLDPANYGGPGGIDTRVWEHVWVSLVSVLVATAVALPVALWLGHIGRGGAFATALANLGRAVPTLALLVILVIGPFSVGQATLVSVIALTVFAIPPILTNTYAGMRAVDPDLVESARGMGLTGRQVLFRVELPLAVPLLVAGLRIATAQVVATLAVAAFIAGPGLGRLIRSGLQNQDSAEATGGAVLVALLAVLAEVGFQLLGRRLAPARDSRQVGEAEVDEAAETPERQQVPVG